MSKKKNEKVAAKGDDQGSLLEALLRFKISSLDHETRKLIGRRVTTKEIRSTKHPFLFISKKDAITYENKNGQTFKITEETHSDFFQKTYSWKIKRITLILILIGAAWFLFKDLANAPEQGIPEEMITQILDN